MNKILSPKYGVTFKSNPRIPGFAKVLTHFLLPKFEVTANLFTNFVYTV